MVRLIVSARLQACLQKLVDHQRHELPLELLDLIQDNLQRILTQSGAARWIDHSVLARIGRWNRQSASPRHEYTLEALICGSDVYHEPRVTKARSPQLEAILAPIRLAQERQEYAALVASNDSQQSRYGDPFDPSSSAFVAAQAGSSWNPNTGTASALTTKQEWDSVKKELGAVFNVLASMGGVATAVWWAAGNTPLVQKTLMALFGALAIALIEAFLYMQYFTKLTRSTKPKSNAIDTRATPLSFKTT